MNIKKDNYLKLEYDYSNSIQTNFSVNASNSIRSPLSSNNHLILNVYDVSSNLSSSQSQKSNLEICLNDSPYNNTDNNNFNNNYNNNNENIPYNLNQTSSFFVNDSNNFSHSNLHNSIISQHAIDSKLNTIDQFSFKQEGNKNSLFINDTKDNCMKVNDNSNNSINILEDKFSQNSLKNNKILLNSDSIPIYTQQLNLKIFNNYILKNKPIIYAKKTYNKKIFGFSAMSFDNNCEANTKISININLGKDKKNSINYFVLYENTLKDDILDKIILSKFEEQNKMIQQINDEILLVRNQNNDLTILSNINSFNKEKENYIIILSSNNANDVKILNNEDIIKYEKNLDFLILINKGIFKFIYFIEINYIIYSILKHVILNNFEFSDFLEQTILSIFEQIIINGGKFGMSIIFICLEGIRKIYDLKDTKKIDEILKRLETLSYEVDNIIMKYNENLSVEEINIPQIIKNNNHSNITFKKTLSGEDIVKLPKKKKKISFFKCCGL